jgi:Tfp pilus assembly protein PilF
MKTLQRLFSWELSVLLLAGMTAGAQDGNPSQTAQSPGGPAAQSATSPGAGEAPSARPTIRPGLTVTSRAEPPLPTLRPDQFTECYTTYNLNGPEGLNGPAVIDSRAIDICAAQLARDTRLVIEKCINRDGKNGPPVVILACTELLERKLFLGRDRFYVYVNRAEAYWSQGDKQHALDDYNEAVKVAPRNAQLYYNRAVFYLAQTDVDAALRDFDTALSLNPKLVPALLQRAKIHKTQDDFSGALADYSEAIRWEPKTAALWSERGYVCFLQHDYQSAIKDEAQAIRLDPKLARAYFFRGAAFEGLSDSPDARRDIMTAVQLDPSLERYVSSKDNNPLAAPLP